MSQEEKENIFNISLPDLQSPGAPFGSYEIDDQEWPVRPPSLKDHCIRFEGGPWHNQMRAIEAPLPTIYPVPIVRTSRMSFITDPFPPPEPLKLEYAKYELQGEYDLETGERCGDFYKLIEIPEWYYKLQFGRAR